MLATMSVRYFPVLAVLAALAGCSGNQGQGCNLVGASDGFRLDLRALPSSERAASVRVEVCLDAKCLPQQPVGGGLLGFGDRGDFLESRPTPIEVRISSDGRVIRRATGQLMPKTFTPNGPDCGPVVSRAAARLDAATNSMVNVAVDYG